MDTNPARVDLAVSSHWLKREGAGASDGAGAGDVVEITLQNRGAFSVAGAVLETEAGGLASREILPVLAAGAKTVVTVPVNRARVDGEGRWILKTRLAAPGGMTDEAPANNERISALKVRALQIKL